MQNENDLNEAENLHRLTSPIYPQRTCPSDTFKSVNGTFAKADDFNGSLKTVSKISLLGRHVWLNIWAY